MSLNDVITGNLSDWQGLPEKTMLESVEATLSPIAAKRGPFDRNRIYQRCRMVEFEREKAPKLVEIWEFWDKPEIFLIEYDDPPVIDLEGTLTALGAPELVLKGKRVAPSLVVEERIYSKRGLTLSVGAPYPGSAIGMRCTHVQLYRSSSTQYFMTEIGTGPGVEPNTF